MYSLGPAESLPFSQCDQRKFYNFLDHITRCVLTLPFSLMISLEEFYHLFETSEMKWKRVSCFNKIPKTLFDHGVDMNIITVGLLNENLFTLCWLPILRNKLKF